MAVKLKDLLVYFEILAENEGGLPFPKLLHFAVKAVPRSFRKKAKLIANLVERGISFADALAQAGLPADIVKEIKGFEEQGRLEEGVKAVLDILRQKYDIQQVEKKLDYKIYQITAAFLIIVGILTLWFLPNMVNHFIVHIGTSSQIKSDPLLRFLTSLYKEFNTLLGVVVYGIVVFVAVVALGVFKIHRKILKLLPFVRKIEMLNDKILFYKIMLVSPQETEAMRQIKRIFGRKYNFDRVYLVFLSKPWDFSQSTLFTQEEKDILRSIGQTASKGILEFLLKEAIRSRNELVEKLMNTANTITIFVAAFAVLLIYGIFFTILMKIQKLL